MKLAEQVMEKPSPVLEQPLKLLFVDDDPLLREFAIVNLASEQGQVVVAEDGEEALAAVCARAPDIVLLDLEMPRMNGFEVLKALRADAATQRLPVIVITARDDVSSIDRAFRVGATSFLLKPINWRQLAYQIRYVHRAAQTELSLVEQVETVERGRHELESISAELAAALRGATAASEAKSQFLATMSHELRTPLNAIIGFSEVIERHCTGDDVEYVRAIKDSGHHLLSLINDILQFSRGEAGENILNESEFPISEVIDEAIGDVKQQAKAGDVRLSAGPVSAALRLRADRRRVRQVLVNVLSNAIKFTPPGGQAIIETRPEDRGLAIAISDTGIGMRENDIPTALERFGQIDSATGREFQGTGLGLPLAKQSMELHGGSLKIDSAVDVGTTVTVSFPASRVVPADALTS